jgi:hypothetical protein
LELLPQLLQLLRGKVLENIVIHPAKLHNTTKGFQNLAQLLQIFQVLHRRGAQQMGATQKNTRMLGQNKVRFHLLWLSTLLQRRTPQSFPKTLLKAS